MHWCVYPAVWATHSCNFPQKCQHHQCQGITCKPLCVKAFVLCAVFIPLSSSLLHRSQCGYVWCQLSSGVLRGTLETVVLTVKSLLPSFSQDFCYLQTLQPLWAHYVLWDVCPTPQVKDMELGLPWVLAVPACTSRAVLPPKLTLWCARSPVPS